MKNSKCDPQRDPLPQRSLNKSLAPKKNMKRAFREPAKRGNKNQPLIKRISSDDAALRGESESAPVREHGPAFLGPAVVGF